MVSLWTKLLLVLVLFVPSLAWSGDLDRQRINLYVRDGSYGAIHHTGPISPPSGRSLSPCFPSGCGGIEGPFRNPEVREETDKPGCYYDARGNLFYEREGKYCPYKYAEYTQDSNARRVDRRRQEWLYRQNAIRVEIRRQEWLRQVMRDSPK